MCLFDDYDINSLKTAINTGLFSADRMFCARKSRLPKASASLLLNSQASQCYCGPLFISGKTKRKIHLEMSEK